MSNLLLSLCRRSRQGSINAGSKGSMGQKGKEPVSQWMYLQASGPQEISMFSSFCARWLNGSNARLRRASVQAFGFIAELDAPQFGKRIRPHIPSLTDILAGHTQQVFIWLTALTSTQLLVLLKFLVISSCARSAKMQIGKGNMQVFVRRQHVETSFLPHCWGMIQLLFLRPLVLHGYDYISQ